MTLPQIFLIVVVAIPLVLVSLDRLRIDVAALLIAVALGTAQYLGMGILGAAHTPRCDQSDFRPEPAGCPDAAEFVHHHAWPGQIRLDALDRPVSAQDRRPFRTTFDHAVRSHNRTVVVGHE